MKLFIWENPYHVDWGGSIVVAVAEDVAAAQAIVKANLNVTVAEPTRVADLPCAESFEWSE